MKINPSFSYILLSFSILALLLYNHCKHITTSNAIQNTTIAIDVGHGGADPGKVSANGTKEKDINLQIAIQLKKLLMSEGFHVILTRETDQSLATSNASNKKQSDLQNRIKLFQTQKADYAISIHQNSFSDSSSHGAQTFYYTTSTEGEEMANAIQNALLSIDPSNHRTHKASNTYYILKKSHIPTVIVECGFLSNSREESLLSNPDYQTQIATAIKNGLCKYLSSTTKTNNNHHQSHIIQTNTKLLQINKNESNHVNKHNHSHHTKTISTLFFDL